MCKVEEFLKLLNQGRFEEIVEILEKRDISSPSVFTILGMAYFKLGKVGKALASFKKAVKLDPNCVDARFNLAEIYLQREKYSKAKDNIIEVLSRNPEDWAAHDILATILCFEGFYESALLVLKRAISLAPDEVRSQLKEKLDSLKIRMEIVQKLPKLAFVCKKGGDNFIDDIIKGLQNDYWIQRRAVKSLKEVKAAIDWADMVWFEWADEVAVAGTNYIGIKGKPTLVRLHSYEAFSSEPLKINWQVVNMLIFVSHHMREIFFEFFPSLKKEISNTEVVYNAVNIEKIPFKEREPGYEIAWVGYIRPVKSPAMAIQIIYELVKKDPRYRLHFAGDHREMVIMDAYLKTIIKRLGLENNVILHGWVEDINEFLEDKNYLIHTSLHESFGYAIVEAMGRGIKPVIHWFKGADKLYDRKWLFVSINDAVRMITEDVYDSSRYRSYIVEKGWTIENQVRKIKKVLAEMR